MVFYSTTTAQKLTIYSNSSNEPLYNTSVLIFNNADFVKQLKSNFYGQVLIPDTLTFTNIEIRRLGYEKLILQSGFIPEVVYLKQIPNMIEEIVVTGLIIPGNKYQSPFKLKFYTNDEIKSKNVFNLAEFLQTENNFSISQDPVLGTRVSLNGLSGQDLNVLLDGVPIAGRLNGNVDYSQILLNNIERIETVDGPLSVIYGTNSAGGVINLITKSKIKEDFQINLKAYAESIGVLNSSAQFLYNYNGSNIGFGFGRNFFGGWDPNADFYKERILPVWRDVSWNPKEQFFANLSFTRRINSRNNLHIKLNSFWETILDKKNPSSSFSDKAIDDKYITQRYILGVTHTHRMKNRMELVTNSNFTHFIRTNKSYIQSINTYFRQKLQETLEYQNNFFIRSILRHDDLSTKVKGLYGIDLKWDELISEKVNESSINFIEVGLFGMFNIQLAENLFFQPGLRFAFHSQFLTPLAPTLNFRYEPLKILSTRLSYSRGYRNPDIKEMYFKFIDNNHNIVGNKDLQSEINDNIQLGFDFKPKTDEKSSHSYSTSFTFSYIIKDKAIEIVPVNTITNEFKYFNVGKSNSLVISLDNRIKYKDLLFSFGFNYLANQRTYSNVLNQIDGYFNNFSLNLNTTYTEPKYKIKFTLLNKFSSPNTFTVLNLAENSVGISRISSFLMTDFNVSKSFLSDKYLFTLGLKNLWNIKNLSVAGVNANFHANNDNGVNFLWGRTVFASIALNLSN